LPTHYSNKTAALIPTFNDDYSLYLCVQSSAPYFDEVWINDDGSTDKTDEVIKWALTTYKNVNAHTMVTQSGWIDSTNTRFSLTNARYVFRLDSDDIMYSKAVNEIRKMKDAEKGCFMLGLQECWGDFHHSRRGLNMNWDPTQLFVDRELCDIVWIQGDAPTYYLVASTSTEKLRWPKPLFFHAPGVKSDERCVLRTMMKGWLTAGKPCPLEEWPPYRRLSKPEIHEKALSWLFGGQQKRNLIDIPIQSIPEISLTNERFEFIYDAKMDIIDRLDHGWIFGLDRK
jgi:glycosyltransferase involved in cell wall biosynthesis